MSFYVTTDWKDNPQTIESEVTCPHCGTVQRDSSEFDDEDTYECECGANLEITREVNVTYYVSAVNCYLDDDGKVYI